MSFAERVTHLKPEGAYFMLARAQALEVAGRKIIHLEIGQPDVPTFGNIAQAGIKAIQDGNTRYTASAGTPALRRAIAEQASAQRGLSFSPENVVVGPGAKPALFFPTLALVRPGDEVLVRDKLLVADQVRGDEGQWGDLVLGPVVRIIGQIEAAQGHRLGVGIVEDGRDLHPRDPAVNLDVGLVRLRRHRIQLRPRRRHDRFRMNGRRIDDRNPARLGGKTRQDRAKSDQPK